MKMARDNTAMTPHASEQKKPPRAKVAARNEYGPQTTSDVP
jgi:hypothetical protein